MKLERYSHVLTLLMIAGLGGWLIGSGNNARSVHAAATFTNASLKGTFGYTFSGSAGGAVPVAGFGILNADGNGGISGTETTGAFGASLVTRPFVGTYAINGDGTGTVTISYTDVPADSGDVGTPTSMPVSAHYSFVIVNGAKELRSVRTDPGVVTTANFAMQ